MVKSLLESTLISEEHGDFVQHSFIPENIAVVVVGSFDSLMLYKPLKELFANMDVHIAYPTFHYFSNDMFKYLNEDIYEGFSEKTVLLTEYDYQDDLSKYKDFKLFKTGLGENSLGVFLGDENKEEEGNSFIDERLDYILSKHLSDKDFYLGYLNRHDWSYYFKIDKKNSIDSKVTFASICILLENSGSRNTNLIVNMGEEEVKELKKVLTKLDVKDPSIAYLKLSKKVSAKDIDAFYKSDSKIKILNPFPLARKDMKRLIVNSNTFVGITGDQSFIEALSLEKIVFYQVMEWKRDFFKNFTRLFGKLNRSETQNFYSSMLNNPNGIKQIRFTYKAIKAKKKKIHSDTVEVKNFISEKLNLRQNLLPVVNLKK
ncbi:MAG: hypothetical protein AB8G05_10880 [Oligoflexales bacterium]